MIGSVLAHIAEGLIRPRVSIERLLAARPTTADAVLMVVAAYALQRIVDIVLAPGARTVGLLEHLVSLMLAVGLTFVMGFLIHRIGQAFGGEATAEQSLVTAAWHTLVMALLWPVVALGVGEIDLTAGEEEVPTIAFLALAFYFAQWVWLLARYAAAIHGFRNEWGVVGVILGVSVLISTLMLAVAGA